MKSVYKIISLFVFIALASTLSVRGNSLDNLALPTATITGTKTVCQNATSPVITFTGSGGTAPYTFTYTVTGLTGNQTIKTTSGNSVTVSAPTTTIGTFTYNLISVQDATSTQNLNLNAVITVINGFSVTAGLDAFVCKGNTINLSSSVSGNGSNAVTYSWSGPNGYTSNQQSPNIPNSTFAMSGIYTVTASVGNCQVTDNINITIPQPQIETLNGDTITDFTECNVTSGIFTFKFSIPSYQSNILNYIISWGDTTSETFTSSSSNPSHTFPIGSFTISIQMNLINGCSVTKTYPVFVGSSPSPATMALFVNQAIGCIPHTTEFTFNVPSTNVNGTTYLVSWGDGTPDETYIHPVSVSTLKHTYNTSSCGKDVILNGITYSNVFQPTVITQNPCSTPQPSGSGLIYIGEGPKASFTPSNSSASIKICTGNSLQLNNTSNFGLTIPNTGTTCSKVSPFYWEISPSTAGLWTASGLGSNNGDLNNNKNWTLGSMTPSVTFNVTGTYTITLRVKNNCGDSSISQTFCVEPSLSPTFTLNTNSGCIPLQVTTNNNTVPMNQCTPPVYNWSVSHTSANCSSSTPSFPIQTTNNASFNFTEAGTYTIKLTAINSCGSNPITQTVIVKKPPTVIINSIPTICQTLPTTSISPTAAITNCGTQALTYLWSFPGGNPATSTSAVPGTISYATAGNHKVSLIVTNECGVTTAIDKTFTIDPPPTIIGNLFSCVGFTSQLTGSGIANSTSPWTSSNLTLATVSSTGLVTAVSAGTATITYTNSNNCKTTALFTVNPAPTITPLVSSSICVGGTPTTLSFTISGATGTPTYQWYSNITNNNIGGTAIPGEINATFTPPTTTVTLYYYCIITLPSGGCSTITTNTATVTVTPLLTINTQPIITQNLCVGATIATPLSVTPTSGIGTFSYQWYSNTTNSIIGGSLITGATSATYTPPVFTTAANYYYYATVSLNGNGCTPVTSNVSEIIVFAAPAINLQPIVSKTLCQGAIPLDLTVSATGGNGTFSYQWYSSLSNSNSGGVPIANATTNSYTPLATFGTKYYYCIVSQNSTTGCSVTSATTSINVISSPTITTQPTSSIICLGDAPNALSISVSGATGTQSYQWYSNNANTISGSSPISSATNATYNPPSTTIGAVYYYCIISLPSGGCSNLTSAIASVIINQNPVISNKTNLICSGNSFTILPVNSGSEIVPVGTTYTWSNPTISPAGSITGATAQTTPQTNISQTLINLTTSPATVTYTVTPISGICKGTNFTIVVTVNPAISPNITSNNNTCFGVNNGAIQTNITGGIPFGSGAPYQIAWTGPNLFSSNATNISNLAPGDYTLSVIDAGGCPFLNTYTITEPADIIITPDLEKDITCFNDANGKIEISVSGGTLNYTYNWTKDGNPFSTTEDLSSLSVGIYVVSISDANNCGPKTATFNITEPPILAVNLVNKTNVLCFGEATGDITVNIVGGTLPYAYSWTGPNGFTSFNQNLNALFAGTHNLIVTDNSGCAKNLSAQLTQTPEIIIKATTTPIICYGDNNASIRIIISGGVSPYQISWSNLGSGTFQDNLSAGDYLITVIDALNCTKTLNVNIPDVPIFSINPVVKNISCFGAKNGSITLNFVGGISPVKLVWSDSAVVGTTRNNLGPGSYTVTITDGKPCVISKTFIILEPQLLVISANVTNAFDCDNANSGAINLLVSGGSPPFTYSWSNGATTEDLNNISAGNYLVKVTDTNGCSKQVQYDINRPPPIITSVVSKTDFDCDTKSVKQTFVAQVSGGVPPYQLVWSSGTVSGANNEMMSTNQNGTVVLFATDAIGCKSNYTFNVDLPALGAPSFTTSSYAYSTYGIYSINDPIQFTNTATGDYISFIWDFGDGSTSTELNPVHIYTNPKDYVVTQTVTYPFGCVYFQKISLIATKGYILAVPNAFTPNNDTLNDTFRPVTKYLKNIRLDVYDTWGSLIYSETGNNLSGWNGKIKDVKAENGNYYSKVSGETFYGTIVNENSPFVLIK